MRKAAKRAESLQRKFESITDLSTLLNVALGDTEIVERSRKCKVSMAHWHTPIDGVCHMCAAGAVLRQRYNIQDHEGFYFEGIRPALRDRLMAINCLRAGLILHAAIMLGRDLPLSVPKVMQVADYDVDREQWWTDMRRLRKLLKENGI